MKRKRSLLVVITSCLLVLCFSTAVYAKGTLYTGPVVYYFAGSNTYNWHYSASANTYEVPGKVAASGFGSSDYSIDEIDNSFVFRTNKGNVFGSYYHFNENTNFTSSYYSEPWPSGASYCVVSYSVDFYDTFYGDYHSSDVSSALYY